MLRCEVSHILWPSVLKTFLLLVLLYIFLTLLALLIYAGCGDIYCRIMGLASLGILLQQGMRLF